MKTNNLLKSRWSFIFAFAAAFVLFFNFGGSKVLAADSSAVTIDAARTISVTGTGEVTVTPDIAYLYLGVITEKPTTIGAESANSTTINNVIAAMKKEGIKDEDIQTIDYSINPKYNYDKDTGKSSIVGYTVTDTLKVTVKDISKVGKVIDTAVKNGANNSNSISFGVSDYEKHYNKALVNALSNAKGKVLAISGFLGLKLTTPVKVVENSNGLPNDYSISLNAKLESADSVSIQAGIYKIKADINLVYQY